MGMKHSWFHHTDCTTQQAEELMAEYQRRGVMVERSLNSDYLTWTVSVRLPEMRRQERTPRTFRQKVWG
ncbi:hypothetical protein ABEJ01_01225 [Enterobacter ludwigii]|jgi:hypothetical protein|uniref:hypothetical protein n=1 Tax=Enterobacter ludwigii TaxID=299767 RepID=UPI001D7AEC62|nr:hypothetical protein [Enterobacter ludwigii]EKS6743913.1 hypothetical protein [Enterobacter ludwigii]CAH0169301.1 hypothetical protein SRABI45_00989 [Enterobacter ludwigii]